ncbi:MAG: histidine phosphatase family protein [Cyanobacteria bacterium P01_D01_bin.105]
MASKDTVPAFSPEASASKAEPTVSVSAPRSQTAEISPQSSAEAALWTKLMAADEETYVVLLRHAIAPGTGDPANFQLDDCSTQRNLSEPGRQQARDIGEAFRDRNIPVTQVLSSQWCRCLETAELMNIAPVEPFVPLNSFFRDRSTAEAQTDQVRDYMAANEASSGVIVMVTHQVNITALSNIFPQSGSAVVMQLNDGQLDVVGQLLQNGG